MSTSRNIRLIVDTRERSVFEHIDEKVKEYVYEIHQINTGDYLILEGSQIVACLERKTHSDFSASFKDERYHHGLEKMLKLREKHPGCQLFYIVEGNNSISADTKIGGIPFKNIVAAITKLMVEHGIFIIYSDNTSVTAERLNELLRAYSRCAQALRTAPQTRPCAQALQTESDSLSSASSDSFKSSHDEFSEFDDIDSLLGATATVITLPLRTAAQGRVCAQAAQTRPLQTVCVGGSESPLTDDSKSETEYTAGESAPPERRGESAAVGTPSAVAGRGALQDLMMNSLLTPIVKSTEECCAQMWMKVGLSKTNSLEAIKICSIAEWVTKSVPIYGMLPGKKLSAKVVAAIKAGVNDELGVKILSEVHGISAATAETIIKSAGSFKNLCEMGLASMASIILTNQARQPKLGDARARKILVVLQFSHKNYTNTNIQP